MPSSQAATVFFVVSVAGATIAPGVAVWPLAEEVRPGIVNDCIQTAHAGLYHLSLAEQRMLSKALYRSARIVQRGAARA